MACRLAEVWLLLIVFLLAASFTRTQGAADHQEIKKKAMAVPAGNNNNNGSPSPPSPSPDGAGNKQSSSGGKGCVTAQECHMKRLVCAKKCTLAAHSKCAVKCSRACSSYPICSMIP